MVKVRGWLSSPTGSVVAELALITFFSFCALFFFFDGDPGESLWDASVPPAAAAVGIVLAILWVLLLVRFIVGYRRAASGREYAVRHAAVPVLLVSVVFTYVVWLPGVAVACIVLAFILEIRHAPPGREWMTAMGVLAFISISLTVAIVLVEGSQPSSPFSSPRTALQWVVANLVRADIADVSTLVPVSSDGRKLAALVVLCAALFAAVMVGAIVAWITRVPRHSRDPESVDQSEALAALTREVQELRAAVEGLRRGEPPRPDR